jgi:hypothetical protein
MTVGKVKAINYSLIEDKDSEPYRILRDLVAQHHTDVAEANFAVAYRHGWKADKDGKLVLGKCQKASDLSRELADYDFIIILNSEVWNSPEFGHAEKVALMDHELSHAAVATDENGEAKQDDRGRLVYRVRKHDLEEFQAVVRRRGFYHRDLQEFAAVVVEKAKAPLFKVAGGE